jgi:hypothetical protein
MKGTLSSRFIDEPIEVGFHGDPPLKRTPRCPDRIFWRGKSFEVVEQLSEWRIFARKGRMAKNLQPQHASRASRVGSWGVGRFYFQVKVETGQTMEIYYDRAPEDSDDRKGKWYLFSVNESQYDESRKEHLDSKR